MRNADPTHSPRVRCVAHAVKIDKLWRHAEVLSKSRGDSGQSPLQLDSASAAGENDRRVVGCHCSMRLSARPHRTADRSRQRHRTHRVGDVGRCAAIRHVHAAALRRRLGRSGFQRRRAERIGRAPTAIIQSFVIDPGRPPRTGEDRRDYMRRWVGSAVGVVER